MDNFLVVTVAGFLSGLAGSLGLGGGGILLLYLTMMAGIPQIEAQGINLIFFLPIAALAIILHARKGLIVWKQALPCAIFGLIGAVCGVFLAEFIGGELLRKIFAGGLLILGIRELFHKKKKEQQKQ